jgi:hypothetical protein
VHASTAPRGRRPARFLRAALAAVLAEGDLAVADMTGVLNSLTKAGAPFVGRDSIMILKK